ncbi:Putative VGR-related protein [Minicystis rosea]|nr:Putative VGR-related protein [Minicystis rosea]
MCEALTGYERLGEAVTLELSFVSLDPVDAAAVLRRPCAVEIGAGSASRTIVGVVTRIAAMATSLADNARKYRATIRSPFALLEHRRRSRVFQHLSVPAIVEHVLAEGGYSDAIQMALQAPHDARTYVVQYAESDAAFVRRLCEEEGLYFRFEARDDGDVFVLEDTSSAAPVALEAPLPVVDASSLASRSLAAFACTAERRRRPGKVTARAFDPEHPAAKLEGVALGGSVFEQGTEVYATPTHVTMRDDTSLGAALVLEALRVEAATVDFRTTAISLAPGLAVELASADDLGTARPEGAHLVVEVQHQWASTAPHYELAVRAIPLAVPYRLPRVTPRPQIAGIHTAIVTGAPGEEVHVDAQGRVTVRFPWDREGSDDHRSSLPVRVAQPNMPGSMLVPRVGWEVLVAFEDGDPDRPFILGRSYNAKQPPPHSLPANKTMTSLASSSSPGGRKQNSITFDDGAGRQHFAISAGNDRSLRVSADMVAQTAKNEQHGVQGDQTRSVGADEHVSVGQDYLVSADTQSASVGGLQKVYVKGDLSVSVGSEAVVIGGALLEQVGNPASGAANLATSAALAGASALGTAGGIFAGAAGLAQGAWEGGKQGGAKGAAAAAGTGLLGMAVGMVPGGDAVLAAVQGAGVPAPWEEPKEAPGAQEGGGGASGAGGGAGGPAGPGPGHRNTTVRGAMLESIGALYAVTTPGPISWITAGASTLLVGGSHTTSTAKATFNTAGASSETVGCLQIRSNGPLERAVKGVLNTTIAGPLTSSTAGTHALKAGGPFTLKVGGTLTLSGAHVTFQVGASRLSSSPGGVLIEAPLIKITRGSKQSGKATHT